MLLIPSNKTLLKTFHYLLLLCLCLPLLTSCESRKIIVNSLDEKEANEIIVYPSTKGINAIKVQAEAGGGGGGGSKIVLWDISVNSDQSLEAMSYLNQVGLPRRRSQNLLNIFTGTGLVPSEMEQKIRYQVGLAEQIASTIRKIDGVLDAEVQISFPEEDPLNPTEKKQKITASVYIKHNGVLDDPNSHLNTKIKRLVAASVAGLDYDNVTIIGERARFNELLGNLISPEEEKQYVSVWTIVLAKESLTRFRILFFSFTISILLLLLALAWILWKVYPVLKSHGGLGALFHLQHLPETPSSEDNAAEATEEPEETKATDKDIDQT
jgi:type III secretion protein J